MKVNKLKHLAILPDGNRRWARNSGISLGDTYIRSSKKIFEFIEYSFLNYPELEEITIYYVSNNNLQRPINEIESIMYVGNYFMKNIFNLENAKITYQIRWIGIDNFRNAISGKVNNDTLTDFYNLLKNAEIATTRFEKKVNVLVGYNPITEINEAVINNTFYPSKLSVTLDVDLVIRTGGMHRLSGFLPLQTQYSELFFINKLFPDFTIEDLINSIENFKSSNRNFGR